MLNAAPFFGFFFLGGGELLKIVSRYPNLQKAHPWVTARHLSGYNRWLKWKIRGEGTVYKLWVKMGPQQVVLDSFYEI